MGDAQLYIVGVPGMGNSEPSWHQRRPFGFSRSGQSKAQARFHAFRRPSTASARLSSAGLQPPNTLAADRSEYRGITGIAIGNGDNNARGGFGKVYPQGGISATRGVRTPQHRERPYSAGCQRSHSPSAPRDPTPPSPGCSPSVAACTRNRAGIIRGGGREGRAAPPATPPLAPFSYPASPTPVAPTTSRPTQPYLNRRRPSTAGEARPSLACDYDIARVVAASSTSCFDANGNGGENAVGSPVVRTTSGRSTGGFPPGNNARPEVGRRTAGGREDGHSSARGRSPNPGHATTQRSDAAVSECAFGDVRQRWPPESQTSAHDGGEGAEETQHVDPPEKCTAFPLGQQRRIVYDRLRGGKGPNGPCRRRPASASPARMKTIDNYGEVNPGSCSFGGVEVGIESGNDKEISRAAAVKKRPRSASASATWRTGERNFENRSPTCRRPASAHTAGSLAGGSCPTTPRSFRPENSVFRCPPAVVPDFVVSERQVLRFYGHFSEELDWGGASSSPGGGTPSPVINIRQIVLYLFLSDGSMEIFETRQINSGQQGGLLLKRNIFKKRDGTAYGAGDLKVGTDLKLLGRSYRMTDCDEHTRRWYEDKGIPQPEAEPLPEFKQCLRVEDTTGLCNPRRPHTASSRPPTPGRSREESSSATRARQEKVQRFFRHDKEVLRFRAVWDDPAVGGTRRYYDLLFYLQDETVALLNPKEERQNSGRDEGAVYVRRQRLPKDWRNRRNVSSGAEGESGVVEGNACIGELDLAVGRVVYVWGRKIRLVGCDPFTKEYYRREHGRDMDANVEEAATERARAKAQRMYLMDGGRGRLTSGPQDTRGDGNVDFLTENLGRYEQDRDRGRNPHGSSGVSTARGRGSLGGSSGGGIGGALPPDRYKGRRIRCKAILMSDMPNDVGREFVITYDLGWDTLMVYELQRRNSGRPGGLFLVKGRHRRPSNNGKGRYYAPQDLYLGAVIPMATGHTLLVTEMDRSSLALCEEFPQEFPLMDCQLVLHRITQRVRNMRLNLRSELRRLARESGSSVPAVIRTTCSAPASGGREVNMLSGWTAGKVFSDNNRKEPAREKPTLEPGAREHPPTKTSINNNLRDSGSTGYGNNNTATGNSASIIDSGGVSTEKRVRSGATWGLVGGWGDGGYRYGAPASNTEHQGGVDAEKTPGGVKGRPYHGEGNLKNESATAPWATVHARFVARGAKISGETDQNGDTRAWKNVCDGCSFHDQAAFRDAMDTLGLLVGLGQQEVLTLMRGFIGQGRKVLWASMCDRISQIATTSRGREFNSTTVGGYLIRGETPDALVEATAGHSTLLRRMREVGAAWRGIFSRVEASAKRTSNGVLGVASLVQAMRRNGLEVDNRGASFLARNFSHGEGSRVDYNRLCDAVYPCNFSIPGKGMGDAQRAWSPPATPADHPPQPHHHNASKAPVETRAKACPAPTANSPVECDSGISGHDDIAIGYVAEKELDRELAGDSGARAPGFDFEVNGTGGRAGGCGGSEGAWSLWDRNRV